MTTRIIIGANLGDEGKGTATARYTKLAKGPVLNILTNGGAQRAHSILTDNGSFTFKHFGSGTYHGADSYFAKTFIINPMQFVSEWYELNDRGVTTNVYRHPDCMWSTPWDMMANAIKEEMLGRHASCGMGIWQTICRYNNTFTIPFDVFIGMEPTRQKAWLYKIKEYYEKDLNIPDSWKESWNGSILMEHFIADCKFMHHHTSTVLTPIYDEIIMENGQGMMLCDTGKDTPDTTPSLTDSRIAMRVMNELKETYNIDCSNDVIAHYVTRPYLTRHGDGYLHKEQGCTSISKDISLDRTNHYNDFQGGFRYGILDIVDLKKRIDNDVNPFKKEIELTHCDEMDRVSEFRRMFNTVNVYDSALI